MTKKDEDETPAIRISNPLNPFSPLLDLRDWALGKPFIITTPPIMPIYPAGGIAYEAISRAARFFGKQNKPQP